MWMASPGVLCWGFCCCPLSSAAVAILRNHKSGARPSSAHSPPLAPILPRAKAEVPTSPGLGRPALFPIPVSLSLWLSCFPHADMFPPQDLCICYALSPEFSTCRCSHCTFSLSSFRTLPDTLVSLRPSLTTHMQHPPPPAPWLALVPRGALLCDIPDS